MIKTDWSRMLISENDLRMWWLSLNKWALLMSSHEVSFFFICYKFYPVHFSSFIKSFNYLLKSTLNRIQYWFRPHKRGWKCNQTLLFWNLITCQNRWPESFVSLSQWMGFSRLYLLLRNRWNILLSDTYPVSYTIYLFIWIIYLSKLFIYSDYLFIQIINALL